MQLGCNLSSSVHHKAAYSQRPTQATGAFILSSYGPLLSPLLRFAVLTRHLHAQRRFSTQRAARSPPSVSLSSARAPAAGRAFNPGGGSGQTRSAAVGDMGPATAA